MDDMSDNPWRVIPLEDYEAHMGSPLVAQLSVLSDLFAEAVAVTAPESVAILGVAGGNGLERLDASRTRRICGIDINAAYLETTRRRFDSLAGLELYQEDLASATVSLGPFDMVHAALIFEHAGLGLCLENAVRMTKAGGYLSVVLQLPATNSESEISPSPVASMGRLRANFSLIAPDRLREILSSCSFNELYKQRRSLPGGKAFWMGIFRRENGEIGVAGSV